MDSGVLSALVAAMSAHELEQDIQVSATAALRVLAAATDQRAGFAASGAVQAVRIPFDLSVDKRCTSQESVHDCSQDAEDEQVITAARAFNPRSSSSAQVINAMKNRPSLVPLIAEGTHASLSFARDKDCRAKVLRRFAECAFEG